MMKCWEGNPEDRPTFSEIREMVETMMISNNPYLDLSSLDESQDCYNTPSFNSVDNNDDDVDDLVAFNEEARLSSTGNGSGKHENNDCNDDCNDDFNDEWDDVFEPLGKRNGPILDFDTMQARIGRITSGANS